VNKNVLLFTIIIDIWSISKDTASPWTPIDCPDNPQPDLPVCRGNVADHKAPSSQMDPLWQYQIADCLIPVLAPPQKASPSPPFALHELAESHHSNSLNHGPSNPQVYEVPLRTRGNSLLVANAEAGLPRIDVVVNYHAPARPFVAVLSLEWYLHSNDERKIRGASEKEIG
jgi:hypothetical protein